jgi:3-deoxy-manno-octulosonate cytidylyltransferase (CMP-KDO synthetase)
LQVLAVIPVRLAAQRLPGKPLAKIGQRTVVEWVHARTLSSGVFDRVIVATPDDEIAGAVAAFGGEVALTSADHETGTDRVAEVASTLAGFDVIANVQGDQPFVTHEMLAALVEPFRDATQPDMVTIGCPLPAEAHARPDVVKVVCDTGGKALYFSRSPIPHGFDAASGTRSVFHHLGLYSFSRNFLRSFAALPPTPLERMEKLEQLRALEHGAVIRVATVSSGRLIEINTPEDLALARDAVGELE